MEVICLYRILHHIFMEEVCLDVCLLILNLLKSHEYNLD